MLPQQQNPIVTAAAMATIENINRYTFLSLSRKKKAQVLS